MFCFMADFIGDCDVYASSTYPVEISGGRRIQVDPLWDVVR